jgi:hypothetical protein
VRIYRLELTFDAREPRYQQLWPVDRKHVPLFDPWGYRCVPRLPDWPPGGILVEVLNPTAPAGAFPFLYAGMLGIDAATWPRLAPVLPDNAEVLDVNTPDGRSYRLLNIADCSDCIDEDRSEWAALRTSPRTRVTRFAFRAERLSQWSLFKPRAAPADLFVSSRALPPQRDFKVQYESLGLDGLIFREVWNDEGDPIPVIPA